MISPGLGLSWRPLAALLATGLACGGAMPADNRPKLEGKVVVHAGEVEQLTCPIGSRYDCLRWPGDLYQYRTKEVCFRSSMLMCSILSCNVLIAVDKAGLPSMFVVQRDKLEGVDFELYRCPSKY